MGFTGKTWVLPSLLNFAFGSKVSYGKIRAIYLIVFF